MSAALNVLLDIKWVTDNLLYPLPFVDEPVIENLAYVVGSSVSTMCKKPLTSAVLSSQDITSVVVVAPFASSSSMYISVIEAYVPLLNLISPAPGSESAVFVSKLYK